jgi:hypothetical protein
MYKVLFNQVGSIDPLRKRVGMRVHTAWWVYIEAIGSGGGEGREVSVYYTGLLISTPALYLCPQTILYMYCNVQEKKAWFINKYILSPVIISTLNKIIKKMFTSWVNNAYEQASS